MKNNVIENIISFFKNHPKFPFENYFSDYDEYVAAHLMALNLINYYINSSQLNDWKFVSTYFDYRRNDPDLRSSLIACISSKREQVFFFAISDSRYKDEINYDIQISLERDDFYGGKWELNLPKDDWYSVFEIDINLTNLIDYEKADQLFKTYFNKKLSYSELIKLRNLYDKRFEDEEQ